MDKIRKILVMDDDSEFCKTIQPAFLSLARQNSLELVFANYENPVESGLRALQEDQGKEIVGLITDSCAKKVKIPFEHIRQFQEIRPGLFIVAWSGNLTTKKKQLAQEAGAGACYQKTASFAKLFKELDEKTRRSPSDRFWKDLPNLLETKFGKWVVYTAHGLQREGEDEYALHEWCKQHQINIGPYVVHKVVPDQTLTEVPDEWLGA